MKKFQTTKSAPAVVIIIGIFTLIFSGCFGEKYKIESPKVSGAEEVSNSCSQNLGLDEEDREQLAKVLKNNGSKYNDEFKLEAMLIITESDGVAPEDRNAVEKTYFSCIENAVNTSK